MKDSLQTDQRLVPVPGTGQDDASEVPANGPIVRARHTVDDDAGHPDDTARLPAITSHPEGIEVVEHEVCHAVGQWVLMVRCQCGKRWFELEAVDAATCPRCNALVFIEVLQPRPR